MFFKVGIIRCSLHLIAIKAERPKGFNRFTSTTRRLILLNAVERCWPPGWQTFSTHHQHLIERTNLHQRPGIQPAVVAMDTDMDTSLRDRLAISAHAHTEQRWKRNVEWLLKQSSISTSIQLRLNMFRRDWKGMANGFDISNGCGSRLPWLLGRFSNALSADDRWWNLHFPESQETCLTLGHFSLVGKL